MMDCHNQLYHKFYLHATAKPINAATNVIRYPLVNASIGSSPDLLVARTNPPTTNQIVAHKPSSTLHTCENSNAADEDIQGMNDKREQDKWQCGSKFSFNGEAASKDHRTNNFCRNALENICST